MPTILDYLTNVDLTPPNLTDTEVFSFNMLRAAWNWGKQCKGREGYCEALRRAAEKLMEDCEDG